MFQSDINDIINVYDSKIVRAYCWVRFRILHQRFLDEIGQYLPDTGRVLDIGCGFGLFSQYYAKRFPDLHILGIDINANRIDMARRAAKKLGLRNVDYEIADVTAFRGAADFDGAYMLDIAHHIPRVALQPLVEQIYTVLNLGCRFLIKDVNTTPAAKLWFTYLLDKAIDVKAELNYWAEDEMLTLVRAAGFEAFYHSMVDLLPYPHILYVCRKK
jgi:2-polyprenyl-3-methyl-5-hydroxy-6-metoxy-1,4-benzoquinol methylase